MYMYIIIFSDTAKISKRGKLGCDL